MDTVKLSIIIVNWHSRDYLAKCLKSICRETRETPFEVIVVDNASYDGSKAMVEAHFNQVQFIQSRQNRGFAKANNLGFQYARGEYLLFLNPDTVVINQGFDKMVHTMSSLPEAGILGCKLLNTDLTPQTTAIMPFPSIISELFDSELIHKMVSKMGIWNRGLLNLSRPVITKVDVISGACLLIRRSVFEKAQYFSTDYFLYSEEADLCYKVKALGYAIYYTNHARVIHHEGGSSQNNGKLSTIIAMKNSRLSYFRKFKGNYYANFYRILLCINSLVRMSILCIMFVGKKILDKNTQTVSYSINKWLLISKWSLGLTETEKQ